MTLEPHPARAPRGRRAARLLLALLLASLASGACTPEVERVRLAPFTAFRHLQAGFTPEQIAFIDDNCGPFGRPALEPTWPHPPTDLVVREGYVLEHSSVDKIPLWVCEHVVPGELGGGARRRNRFRPDPLLEGKPRAELSDYRRSGFDRGHQAPAGDQTSSQELNDETFFLSNMVPQVPANNQQVWRELETMVRGWVADGAAASAWVVTGPMFYDPAEDDPDTADGLIPFEAIGDDQVSVPTHLYKIVLAQDVDDEWRAVAFVLENRGYPRPFDFSRDIQTIDWIEERTGIDFFPDLDPITEPQVEGQPGTLWSPP